MKNAEMKIIRFDESDVIATSGYYLTGLFDGTLNNHSFTRYATLGDKSSASTDVWDTYMNSGYIFIDYKGEGVTPAKQDGELVAGKASSTGTEPNAGASGSTFNGWYTFDGDHTFTHINKMYDQQ